MEIVSKKRKLNELDSSTTTCHDPSNHCFNNYFDPSFLPSTCYQLIFQYLPIQSLVSVALTSKKWYDILSSNKFCCHQNTKLTLLDANQFIAASHAAILRHVNRIEIGTYQCGLSIHPSRDHQFYFTSLYSLKLCFLSLPQAFVVGLFHCISPTLGKLNLAMQPYSVSTLNEALTNPVTSCLHILSALHLLHNLTHFSILVKPSAKIEFDIDTYFKGLSKLQTLIIRQDTYTHRKSRIKQLRSLTELPSLTHLEWFEMSYRDLEVLSSVDFSLPLQHIHLQNTLITNELLFYLSKLPNITSLKSDRFSPIKTKLNVDGFHHLLALRERLKDLEISAKNISYDELLMIQDPEEADCTENEYEVYLTLDHINVLKMCLNLQFLSLNRVNINKPCMDDLLITLSKYNRLKVLQLEAICFPSFKVLSQLNSLKELSLSYPCSREHEEYTDSELVMLSSLKNLKVLILYHSMNLSKAIRKQLKERTLRITQSSPENSMFEHLEEFIYNEDDDESCEQEDEYKLET